MRPQNTGGCTMNKVLVGVVSAADFERAQALHFRIVELRDYDDWLDSRYGHFMGLSIGGAEASLETVALDDFLDWCDARRLCPSESALDAYAQHSGASLSPRTPLRGVETSQADRTRPTAECSPPVRSERPLLGPNSASLSAGSDLKKG